MSTAHSWAQQNWMQTKLCDSSITSTQVWPCLNSAYKCFYFWSFYCDFQWSALLDALDRAHAIPWKQYTVKWRNKMIAAILSKVLAADNLLQSNMYCVLYFESYTSTSKQYYCWAKLTIYSTVELETLVPDFSIGNGGFLACTVRVCIIDCFFKFDYLIGKLAKPMQAK